MGDGEKRLTDMKGAAASERRKLDRALADLGIASVEQLTASRSLAFSEIDAYEKAKADGQGVAVVDGKIVENLHVETATRLLGKADAIKLLEGA